MRHILSILAEDHAPAALRPSILLAIDWPTVAEEAPATGDDSGIAYTASGLLSGIGGREDLPALTLANLPLLAARLATVAASLTTTGGMVALYGIGSLFGSLSGGALADRIGRKTTMVISLSARAAASISTRSLGCRPWRGAEVGAIQRMCQKCTPSSAYREAGRR